MVNVHDMDDFNESCDVSSVRYLKTLLVAENNIKFDFHHFETLIQNENVSKETILHDILTSILQLFEKCDKNFQMCSDLAYCFCVSLSLVPQGTSALFDILEKTKITNSYPSHFDDIDTLIQENYCVFILGMLKFLEAKKYRFELDQCDILNSKVIDLVAVKLLDQNNVNTLLCTIEAWLTIVSVMEINESTLKNIYTSVFSVAIIYWNIDIAEFRNRVENIFLKCLCLNYEKDAKRKSCGTPLNVIVNMMTVRAIAYDMYWSLPFKYYAYVVALKFIVKVYQLPKFLKHIRNDLRVGFAASLRNKRVISVETELFKFCTNSTVFDGWREIFCPLIEDILSSTNVIVANNFSRYWLPVIVRNFPSFAAEIFDRIPKKCHERTAVHSRILFSLFKVCHLRKVKLIPVENVDDLARYLQRFFFDVEDTQGELFALLCNLGEQSTLHSEQELRTILTFLKNHARTTSTILRQSLFSSFAAFVLRLICSSVKAIKYDPDDAHRKLNHVLRFLVDLNEFLVNGLETGCSYQRKLVSLTLYKILMTYALRDCGAEIRKNNLKSVEIFVDFAKRRHCWGFGSPQNCKLLFRCLMDPCEEIRNLSFALLRTFFDISAVDYRSPELYSHVVDLLSDSLFYKRNSGVSAALSLICLSYNFDNKADPWLLKNAGNEARTCTDMFLEILEKQVTILREDIMNSAVHYPLDSSLKILIFLMTDASSPEYSIVSESQIEKLISLLEIVVPLLLKALFIDKFSDYAPSFEESDNALEAIIRNSSVANELNLRDLEQQAFQLKPINQILLNFIWISLKICSELESCIISSRFHSLDEAQLIRCGDLVVSKLKLCRHKGVIEAAGISLSNIVRILTENSACDKWLESVMSDVIYLIENKSGATVSRKSAGLSLLVQSIVGNDRRTNKPLLSFCWREFRRILNVDFHQFNQTVLEELPQTHVLHFLKVLTSDARNSEELSVFFEEIALVCLKALKAPIWTIRNAALQLFGAIVPKMVGQKNWQNDFGVRRSFEEVFVRMPTLLEYMVSSFETSTATSTRTLTTDSDLVPLLIILVNVQVSNVHLLEAGLQSNLIRLRKSIRCALGSELHFVRELAGKSFVSLHCESEISVFKTMADDVVEYIIGAGYGMRRGMPGFGMPHGACKATNIQSENHLHGHLLLLRHAFSSYSAAPNFRKKVISRRPALPLNAKFGGISLKCAALLHELEMVRCAESDIFLILNRMTEVLDDLALGKHLLVGHDEWSYVLLRRIFSYSHKCSFRAFASYCLNSSHASIRDGFLRIFSACDISSNAFVFDSFRSSLERNLRHFPNVDSSALSELFGAIVKLCASSNPLTSEADFCELLSTLPRLDPYQYQAANLLVLCSLTTEAVSDRLLNDTLKEISRLLYSPKSNRDVRHNVATALLSLLNKHGGRIDSNLIWRSIVEVLQDEELEIRSIGCECYRSLRKLPEPRLHSEIALNELFSYRIMRMFLPLDVTAEILWGLLATNDFEIDTNDEIANPFDQGVFNVYKENCRIVSLAGQTLVEVLQKNLASFSFENELCSIMVHYYNTFAWDILRNAERILKNPLLVSSESYTLSLRCYYLLLVFTELCREYPFSSSVMEFDSDESISGFNYLSRRAGTLSFNLVEKLSLKTCRNVDTVPLSPSHTDNQSP